MPSIGGLIAPLAAAQGVQQSLALARGANPRAAVASGSFDRQLDHALRAGTSVVAESYGLGVGVGTPTDTYAAEFSSASNTVNKPLRVQHEAAIAAFGEYFRALLRQHNIDLEDGVVLATGPGGDVQVIGEHPHKQAIEQLFRDDAVLRTQFSQLDAQATLLSAAESAEHDSRLSIGGDAPGDVRQFLDPLSPSRFSMAIGRDSIRASIS